MLVATAMTASADGKRYGTIRDKVTREECGACHLAYPAGFLPAVSWKKIIGNLPDHFGDDASLDEETTKHVLNYYLKHSRHGKFRNPAMRITELRWFVREHRHEVSRRARKRAGTMSNCQACHRGAARGYFDDD